MTEQNKSGNRQRFAQTRNKSNSNGNKNNSGITQNKNNPSPVMTTGSS